MNAKELVTGQSSEAVASVLNSNGFSIRGHPASGLLPEMAPVTIRLYNRFGTLYYEKQGVDLSQEHLIHVSSFPANIYVLEVQSAEVVKTVQVLKNQ